MDFSLSARCQDYLTPVADFVNAGKYLKQCCLALIATHEQLIGH